jgi:2-polyprenyl-3-methyl-5-hydroxy-6-metoxy-1,4-benzoquinol methylase
MIKLIKKIISKFTKTPKGYDFNESNPLGGNGERVDIVNGLKINYEKLDLYQKNHFKRYEFASKVINNNDVCGDFACGTGYGSIMLSKKASQVFGIDINSEVISQITERYKSVKNVSFSDKNLLTLDYSNFFDTIVSFETIEHFKEEDILKLLELFSKALKQNGKLIFSTPYLQERSEDAIKLGFHLTFNIDENKIDEWLQKNGFEIEQIKFQNYDSHLITDNLEKKEFIICIARKK